MIVDPVTISPDLSVRDAMEIMTKYRVSGLPVTQGPRLVGILTNRDLRFEKNLDQAVSNVMTKDNLVTVPVARRLKRPSESCKHTGLKSCSSWTPSSASKG